MSRPTVAWRKGSLFEFDSIGIVGARYCAFNSVTPAAFVAFLHDFFPAGHSSRSAHCVDDPAFDLAGFAAALGEPLRLVRTLSPSLFSFTSCSDLEAWRKPEHLTEKISYCASCIAQGRHSFLHQLGWTQRCLLHDEPLRRLRERCPRLHVKAPDDVRFVAPLIRLLRERSIWPYERRGSKGRADSPQVLSTPGTRTLVKAVQAVNKKVQADASDDARPYISAASERHYNLCVTLLSRRRQTLDRAQDRGDVKQRVTWFAAEPAVAAAVLKMIPYHAPLRSAQHLAGATIADPPRWVRYLHRLLRRLERGHESCCAEMSRPIMPSVCFRSVTEQLSWLDEGWRALSLAERGYSTCQRVAVADLLREQAEAEATIQQYGLWKDERWSSWDPRPFAHLGDAVEQLVAWRPVDVDVDLGFCQPWKGLCLAPQGVLAEVIDHLGLAWAHAWKAAAALLMSEGVTDSERFTWRIRHCEIAFDLRLEAHRPSFIVQRCRTGLKVSVLSPLTEPNLALPRLSASRHRRHTEAIAELTGHLAAMVVAENQGISERVWAAFERMA